MFKIETHAHTSEISPCSRVSAARMIDLYNKLNYQGIIITDHLSYYCTIFRSDRIWKNKIDAFFMGYDRALEAGEKKGMLVLAAFELSFKEDSNDYLVYGLGKEDLYLMPPIPQMH